MPGPRISVVVPFHNNADVLGECLTSIAAQSFADFEVIMVDDGSRDDGAGVAAAQAAADPRFRLVRVSGGSPGFARNQGVTHATGEYLSFVDGDDTLPADALERLLATLEASGSDFVSGNVQRIGPHGVTQSPLHARAIKGRTIGTHISRSPELFFDVSVWNKLFRRSFWDARGLVFAEGVVWEDLQLMTKAHVLARAVDVIPDYVYFWRERTQGELSITQSRTSIENLRDRVTALLVIDEFLGDREPPGMKAVHQHKALLNDLWLYVPDIARTAAEHRDEYVEEIASYLAQVDENVVDRLPSTHKLAYHLIARRMTAQVLQYAAWLGDQQGTAVPVIRERGRMRADLPFRTDRSLGIPASVYRVRTRELDPFVRVEAVDWRDGALVISGCAYVPSVDVRKRRYASKIIILRPRQRGRLPVVAVARSFVHPEATHASGQQRYHYDWAGFTAAISTRRFRTRGRWLPGEWDGFVLVRGHGVWRAARLHTPAGDSAQHPQPREVAPSRGAAPSLSLGARWIGQRLQVRLMRASADVSDAAATGRAVLTDHSWSPGGRLTLRGRYAGLPGEPIEAVLTRSGTADEHVIQVEQTAVTRGDDPPYPPAATEFTVVIDPAAMPSFGRRQPLRDGRWELSVRRVGGVMDEVGVAGEADQHTHKVGPKLYRLTTAGATTSNDRRPVLTVSNKLRLTESGRIQRRALRTAYYPLQQRRGLRDQVLFVSFKGWQASDNPLGIAAELRRRGDAREHVWVVGDWSVPVPEGARPVLVRTQAYWDALARSAYVVSNDDMPEAYQKRPGQIYVQTWHGTPLKRIGFDVEMQSVDGARYLRHLEQDVARWDLLLSPNPFSTPILRRAFRFGGEILESGYPRNDMLASGDTGALAAAVRQRLGLPPGKRVVMYAPTWRENQFDAAGRYRFDFRLDLERAWQELGDDYVFLIRGHHQVADDAPAAGTRGGIRPGFARNVSAYPDVSELFLVADVLITDYSSMICDFAVTGKPILLFTYDLADYRDNLRGLYVDLEAEAPGPLLSTSDEVIAAVGNIDAVSAACRQSYEAFAAKFAPLDDGKAGARVCDRVFGG